MGAVAQGAKPICFQMTDLANMTAAPRGALPHEVEARLFVDDGLVPNNGKLPLILYRHGLALEHASEPERAFETLFKSNGWRGAWVDGIYDFHHYHSTAHEVLGIAQGSAKVQLGGPQGLLVDLDGRRRDGDPGRRRPLPDRRRRPGRGRRLSRGSGLGPVPRHGSPTA